MWQGQPGHLRPHSAFESALCSPRHSRPGRLPIGPIRHLPAPARWCGPIRFSRRHALAAPPLAGRCRGAGPIGSPGREGRARQGRGPRVHSGPNGDPGRNPRESGGESAQKAPGGGAGWTRTWCLPVSPTALPGRLGNGGTPVGVRMDRQGGARTLCAAKFWISPWERATSILVSSRKKRMLREGAKPTQARTACKSGLQRCVQLPLVPSNSRVPIPSAGGRSPQPRTGLPHRGLLPEPPQPPQISLHPHPPPYTPSPRPSLALKLVILCPKLSPRVPLRLPITHTQLARTLKKKKMK